MKSRAEQPNPLSLADMIAATECQVDDRKNRHARLFFITRLGVLAQSKVESRVVHADNGPSQVWYRTNCMIVRPEDEMKIDGFSNPDSFISDIRMPYPHDVSDEERFALRFERAETLAALAAMGLYAAREFGTNDLV